MPAKSVHCSGNQRVSIYTLLIRTGLFLPGFFMGEYLNNGVCTSEVSSGRTINVPTIVSSGDSVVKIDYYFVKMSVHVVKKAFDVVYNNLFVVIVK